jgi:hypothetical protein
VARNYKHIVITQQITNNILIGHNNNGTSGESNVIKTGTNQTSNYIARIYNMSPVRDVRPVFIDSNGKLTTTFSTNVIPMGELFYENLVTDIQTLILNTVAQFAMLTGLYYNTKFSSLSNAELKNTSSYSRYVHINASISCILAAGTNQLLNFELRKNGTKISVSAVKALFKDNTDYQTIHLNKLVPLNPDDIFIVWVTNTSCSNDLQVYNFNWLRRSCAYLLHGTMQG